MSRTRSKLWNFALACAASSPIGDVRAQSGVAPAGMVDSVVHRHEMKSTVSRIARMLTKSNARDHEVGALVPA